MTRIQRLIPRSLTPRQNPDIPVGLSIEEGVKASVKDPLWFLSRQFQMNEFTAGSCGSIAEVDLETEVQPINALYPSLDDSVSINESIPLEPYIEAHNLSTGKDIIDLTASRAWLPDHLEYQFSIGTNDKSTCLDAKEYYGEHLDWYNFSISSLKFTLPILSKKVYTRSVTFPGMPKARFWEYEDAQVDLGDIQRPNLNILSMLLTEFALLYSNDWFIIPFQQVVNSIRNITKLKVIDVFGKDVNIVPHTCTRSENGEDAIFTMFTYLSKDKFDSSSSILFIPNTLTQQTQSEPYEEVFFLRDEMANLVWAVEKKYFDDRFLFSITSRFARELNKKRVLPELEDEFRKHNHILKHRIQVEVEQLGSSWKITDGDNQKYYIRRKDECLVIYSSRYGKITNRDDEVSDLENDVPSNESKPVYRIKSPVAKNWIPYLPIHLPDDPTQTYFRRGRTIILQNGETQYKSNLIKDGKKIMEEEIPSTPITLTQNVKMAVYDKEDGSLGRLIWVARKKNQAVRLPSSGLKFDYLIEPGKNLSELPVDGNPTA